MSLIDAKFQNNNKIYSVRRIMCTLLLFWNNIRDGMVSKKSRSCANMKTSSSKRNILQNRRIYHSNLLFRFDLETYILERNLIYKNGYFTDNITNVNVNTYFLET